MPRASDSPRYRASDSTSVATWASDHSGPDAWASDPERGTDAGWADAAGRATDSPPNRATDPAPEWGGRAWGATDRISTLTSEIGLAAALDAFCAGKAAEGLSPRSIVWYRMIGERLVARFGADRPVDALTAGELRAWLVELRVSLSPMSVAGYVRGLRAFGSWLSTDGLATARALRTLTRPRVPRKLIEPLSDADLRRLLSAAGERDRAVLLLLLDTGLRVSEVVGIRLGDLRPDGSIKVLGKGAAERSVPVGGAARRAIGQYLAQRGPGAPGEPLFLNQADQALTTSGVSQLLRRLRRRSGVAARCNPHSFRHTFAHNYLVNGGDALSLQRILGHSSLEMVRRYVALSDVDLAGRHRAASPADRLVARPSVARSLPPAPLSRWSGASGGPGSGAQSRRSTGDTLRWTARRSSSSRSR
jgi:site-specific recombinase XerD